MSRKKIGLALSGGAARGFAHLGVVKVLQENNIPIDFIAGTSAGAVVGGGIASGLSPDEMLQMHEELSWLKIGKLSLSFFGVQTNEPLADFVRERYPIEKIEDLKIPFSATATDLDTGELIVFDKGDLASAVRASSNIPVIYAPIVDENNRRLVDGGVAQIVPCALARKMGADVVIAVDLNSTVPKFFEKPNNAVSVLMQTAFLAIRNLTKHNLQDADIVIQPDLSDFRYDEIKRANDMFEVGRQTALDKLDEIKALIG